MKPVIRAFFQTLRLVLGPVMLLKERLTSPEGMQRDAAAQAAVDLQCQSLALYQFNTCPFCIKVRQEMRRLSLPIEKRDATQHRQPRRTNARQRRHPSALFENHRQQRPNPLAARLEGHRGLFA
jgi:glutaredoxin